MPKIRTEFLIKASIELCFDLARDIDIHVQSTAHSREKAISGVISGLIGLNETVTWRAFHFGIPLILTSQITEFNPPFFFVDEMVKGPFKRFRHEHKFSRTTSGTQMVDIFDYTSPLGFLGKTADILFLTKYMETLLVTRNNYIKEIAETRSKYDNL